ncbi:hypothetical protein SPURM210S_08305 [Streptomyces purpurascens]|nr:hypothetical protein GCM10010303_40170 [Streptomyces purpurascens]
MGTGPESGSGVITLAASLNAVRPIVRVRHTQVSTTHRNRATPVRHPSRG